MKIEKLGIIVHLEKISPELHQRFKQLIENVNPIVNRVYSAWPDLTEHDQEHLTVVLRILDLMIPPETLNAMSPEELFILLCGAWLHDIGLSLEASEFYDGEKRKKIRDIHHIRGADIINKKYKDFALKQEEAEVICEIVKAHRKTDISSQIKERHILETGKIIRLQLLSSLVMIADELHITKDRTSELLIDLIKPRPESLIHHLLHRRIKGPAIEYSLETLNFDATPETEHEQKLIEKIKEKIQAKINSVVVIFRENAIPLRRITVQFNRRKIIEKKVLLALAQRKSMSLDEVAKYTNENISDVDLIANEYPYVMTRTEGKLQLEYNFSAFEKL